MTIQQMFVAFSCLLLATQQIAAVVNNPKSVNSDDASLGKNVSTTPKAADAVAAASETEAKRREAPIGDSYDSYAPTGPSNPTLPIPVYGVPDAPSNNVVYPAPPPDIPPPLPAVPSISTLYGAPLQTFNFAQSIDLGGSHLDSSHLTSSHLDSSHLTSSHLDSSHLSHFGDFVPPPPPPPTKYGVPIKSHKPFHSGFHSKPSRPRPQYGPPLKQVFAPKPKPSYGPPKQIYGPPKTPLFVPQKQHSFKQQSVAIVTIPQQPLEAYGPPPAPVHQYGPPEPVHHGPPHPGVPAPPTPPDIKYDGWQPIPGLVSRPPSDSYGVPEGEHHGTEDLHFNSDFTPPPIGNGHGHISTSSHSAISVGYSPPAQGVSDSYGAPLNSVTGSGAVVSSPGDAHHDDQSLSLGLSAAGINSHSHLSVVKSIGYELFPHSGALSHIGDSYSAPPASSYSPNGPYAAAHSYKTNGLSSSSFSSFKTHHSGHSHGHSSHSHSSHDHGSHSHGSLDHGSHSHGSLDHGSHSHGSLDHGSHSHGSHDHGGHALGHFHVSQGGHFHGHSSGIGLIPPSGVYGAPPSGHYGTPLLSKPSPQYGAPLNALKINPPKHPVIFREPVPVGLIESIGQHTAHKDAHGIIESSHGGYSQGPTYIPPPIPDVTKPVKEEEPPAPSHLYSLPSPTSSLSFQNVGHGHDSSFSSFGSFGLSSSHLSGGHGQAFTSYTAPLGSIDGSYSLPIHSGPGYSVAIDNAHSGGLTVGIDNSLPPVSIDLTASTTKLGHSIVQVPPSYSYQAVHDCKSHSSQPLPTLSYGVPSASSYTQSLSSLTTNIGGHSIPSGSYGPPDLQTQYSKKVTHKIPARSYGTPDLDTQHSKKVTSYVQSERSKKVSTTVPVNLIEGHSEGKSYGKSLAQKFGPEAELVKSESIDINNIPVKGSLGTYTLQIQPADDLLSSHGAAQVSHSQVLNGGLLQSILAAIEQPGKKDATILGRPLAHLKPGTGELSRLQPSKSYEVEGQSSETHAVVVPGPTTTTTTTAAPEAESEAALSLIDDNEIALYFNKTGHEKSPTEEEVRNAQQYGSYVSFKTPTASFGYSLGDKEEPRD